MFNFPLIRSAVLCLVSALLGFAFLAPTSGVAWAASDYPSKTIRWIVPYGAGGSYDRLARLTAPALGARLGGKVVVSNVRGPDGYNRIYRAKPDGHTIGSADALGERAKALIRKQAFDIEKFTWIGRGNAGINLMVASPKSEIRSFGDLKTASKPVRFAAFGFAGPTVQFIALAESMKIPYKIVNFRGPRETVIGVVRGDADIGLVGTGLWLKQIKAGNVRPIMAWSAVPDRRQPGAPTLKNLGALDLLPLMNQRAFIAPPDLPGPILTKLTNAFRDVYSSKDFKQKLTKMNFELNPLWGDDFERVLKGIRKVLRAHTSELKKAARAKK